MHVKKQVFHIFKNLRINVTRYILFLICQVLNIKYLHIIQWEAANNEVGG